MDSDENESPFSDEHEESKPPQTADAKLDDAIARGVVAATADISGPGAFPVRGVSYVGGSSASASAFTYTASPGSGNNGSTVEVVNATLVQESVPLGGDVAPLPIRSDEGAATDAAADQWCSFTLADRRVQCCLALGLLTIVGLAFGLGLALGVGRDASAATTAAPAPAGIPAAAGPANPPRPYPSPRPTAAPAAGPAPGTCYDVLRGNCVGSSCDFYQTVRPYSVEGCEAECEKRPSCVAIDHDGAGSDWDGRCYLFRGGGCRSDGDPDVRCRIARPCTEEDGDRPSSESEGWDKFGDAIWPRLESGDDFGTSVAVSADGTTVASAAPFRNGVGRESGQVRVYRWFDDGDGVVWRKLGNNINGLEAFDELGDLPRSIDLNMDGTVVAVGSAHHDDDRGVVMVLQYIEGDNRWKLLGEPILGNPGDRFGSALALNAEGHILVVGAPEYDGKTGILESAGQLRSLVWDGDSGDWEEFDTVGGKEFSELGTSVALSADGLTVAVGAPFNSQNGDDAGAVAVYHYDEIQGWLEQVGNIIFGEEREDNLGIAVAISADASIVAVCAAQSDSNTREGAVRVLRLSEEGRNWEPMGQALEMGGSGDWFGRSIALSADGHVLVTIASEDDEFDLSDDEHRTSAYRFDKSLARWVQLRDFEVDGEPSSIAISGDGKLLVLGFPYDEDDLDGGHVRVFGLE